MFNDRKIISGPISKYGALISVSTQAKYRKHGTSTSGEPECAQVNKYTKNPIIFNEDVV